MNEQQKQEMIETVRERVGFEEDVPELDEFWDWYQSLPEDSYIKVSLDRVLDYTIITTYNYLEEPRG
ncbi:hypothetical protein SEA_WESAK_11 [Microbacterium phage Wesak]|uniref:Uncharacterized protein n=1 Tax=Microbacterium phage Wesak TaxID=2653751 RepID=A0A5Q2WJJ1_9CAUD|nr:hypothetical protein SEA_WESAK_11 [Microbacterium phage Wesak]